MKYQSDILIDKFINEIIFRNKKDGFFVEIGALDGIIFSNSYIFEKYLNWSGLCVEPDLRWRDSIIQNRKCNISFNVISDTSDLDVEFCIHKNGGESFVKTEKRNWIYDNDILDTYKVKTLTLTDLLDLNNSPKLIDWISVDTEGSEINIISKFLSDSKYTVNFINIEHTSNDDIDKLFEESNFIRINSPFLNLFKFDPITHHTLRLNQNGQYCDLNNNIIETEYLKLNDINYEHYFINKDFLKNNPHLNSFI
jgi:FkbM family methyltransferase